MNARVRELKEAVLAYYRETPRDFPWRRTRDPWAILVSEVMLQQTQTARVAPKYEAWMEAFPDPGALASAKPERVISLWSGLGYNRRALALRDAARIIVERHGGTVPRDERALDDLPGIGIYTARAVLAFAFGENVAFIETNIRAVFIHFCFADRESVSDKEIMVLAEEAAKGEDPREWNYALMDYGAALKRVAPNPNRKSSGYARQSKFEGSVRQVRGAIVRKLSEGPADAEALYAASGAERERFDAALGGLAAERVVVVSDGKISLRD